MRKDPEPVCGVTVTPGSGVTSLVACRSSRRSLVLAASSWQTISKPTVMCHIMGSAH